MSLFQLENPIPDSCKDTGKLKQFWDKLSGLIVPYYGYQDSTSHSFLKVLFDLTSKSPSFSAVNSDLNNYAFGKNLDIVQKTIPGWNDPDIEGKDDPGEGSIPREEQLKFIEWLKELGISLTDIIGLSKELATHQRESGNAYLNIKIVQVGGTVRVKVEAIHYRHICYLRTAIHNEKEFIYSPYWDLDYMKKNPPRYIKASSPDSPFVWSKMSNGVIETVVHFKTKGNDDGDLYGRPAIIAVMEWMYSEICLGDHSVKVNGSDLTAKILIMLEGEDINADEGGDEDKGSIVKAVTENLRKIASSSGNKVNTSSIAALEYPNGLTPPKVEKLAINRDTQWFEKGVEVAGSYVYGVLGWSKELSGFSQTKGGIGSNILIDMFIIKNESTIKPIQCEWENNWGAVIGQIAEALKREDMKETGIKFQDNISSMTESLIKARSGLSVPEIVE